MSFLTLAVLQAVDPASLDVPGAAKSLLDAVVNKNWWLVAGLAIWLAVTLVRKYGSSLPFLGKFLSAGWSGPVLAALFAAAGALLTALFAGEPVSLKLLFSAFAAAASAVFTQELGQKAKEAAAGSVKSVEDADKVLKG